MALTCGMKNKSKIALNFMLNRTLRPRVKQTSASGTWGAMCMTYLANEELVFVSLPESIYRVVARIHLINKEFLK